MVLVLNGNVHDSLETLEFISFLDRFDSRL
jgi:hypothetical protein